MTTSVFDPRSLRLPDTYELVRLGYVARLQNGLTVDAKRDVTGDVVTRPYLRVANVQAGSLNLESVTEITVPRSVARRSTLRPGDVLMTEGGDLDKLGRGTVWQGELEGCLHQNHIFAIRPDPQRLNGRFLAYLTQSLYGRCYFESTGTRTTNLASTNSNKIQSFPLPLPPLEEQRRIVDFLYAETARIDNLAAKRRRMRDLLGLKRERVIESALGLERGSTPYTLIPLKYMVDAVSVGIVITPAKWYVDSGGTPALRGLNVKAGSINTDELVQISAEGHAEHGKSRLHTGDVVVVRTGQAGAAAVVPPELDGANCIDLIIVRPGQKVSPKYLEYVLNSGHARAQVSEHAVGSIQAHFNVGAMKQIPVPALARAEQEEIALRLDQLTGSIDHLHGKLIEQEQLLAEHRQTLITAAVTGQFDVSTASGRNVTDGVPT